MPTLLSVICYCVKGQGMERIEELMTCVAIFGQERFSEASWNLLYTGVAALLMKQRPL